MRHRDPLLRVFLLGCADSGKAKYLVSGTVTFDGVPVVDGHI